MVEVLGQLISKKRREGQWKGINVADGIDLISHLQFLDYTYLMGESTLWEYIRMRVTIDKYIKALGQCVNWKKIRNLFFPHYY